MKTKQSLQITICFLGAIIGCGIINAQTDQNNFELQRIGFGLQIEQFRWGQLEMDMIPTTNIIISVNVSQRFRIEPEIGFKSSTNKESNLTDKSIHIGCSLFGMQQKNNINIYGGLKFGLTMIRDEHENWPSNNIETDKFNFVTIGPILGCEYFFGSHFSFGGEISLNYTTSKEHAYFTTDTGLIARFYFK